jgi:hypothetical protein
MKPIGWLVAVIGGVAGCAPDSARTDREMRGRVVEGADAGLAREDGPSLDVAIFWLHRSEDASRQYAPMKVASVEGDVPVDFSGALPDTPSDDQLIPIHDPKTGFVPDPEGVVGLGMLYVTAGGALEDNPVGVNALDVGVVLGMARDTLVFFTSVDLETTDGLEPFPTELIDEQPLAAGYHLFIGPDEVDLATPIEAELGYVAG